MAGKALQKTNRALGKANEISKLSGLLGGGGIANTAPLKFGDAGPSSAGQTNDVNNKFTGGSVNFGSSTSIPIIPFIVLGLCGLGGWYVLKKK
ncbi:hypothetical protein C5F63_06035 [Photobacterium damselae subsp. damselae]|uniref:hypothetical protein n=1 Tax=Photobacterium damselae TaxID=38293 RepID=UPI000D07CCEB|nr:hypothetical protein [Photobacterium damselae]PSB89067.1 hypothetical protein C5F63_06035 [Photobacterium damselae subsp. damselae]